MVIPHLAAESVPALESPDATAASVDAREDRLASVLEEGLAAVPDADKLPQADIDEALSGCGQEWVAKERCGERGVLQPGADVRPRPRPAEAEVAKETLFDFISTKMTGSAAAEVTEETLPSAPETKESEETVQAWTALLSRIPARWDGEPETSEEFKDVMRKGAMAQVLQKRRRRFFGIWKQKMSRVGTNISAFTIWSRAPLRLRKTRVHTFRCCIGFPRSIRQMWRIMRGGRTSSRQDFPRCSLSRRPSSLRHFCQRAVGKGEGGSCIDSRSLRPQSTGSAT